MSPAPLCLALAVAVLLPSTQAMQCYKCADVGQAFSSQTTGDKASKGLGDLFGGLLGLVVPPCKDFDASEDRFKTECESPNPVGCTKTILGDVELRGCQESKPGETPRSGEGCAEHGNSVICVCQGNLCNGAATVLPGLLLVLPAALALLRL